MNNKNVRGIIALVVVTALSFGVITGSKMLSKDNGEIAGAGEVAAVLEELDTAGAENIEKAVKTENGYMVTVKTKGYGGDILMNVSFDEEVKNVTKVEIVEHSETQDIGAKITEADFLSQFEGVAAPVYLPGMSIETADAAEKTEAVAEDVVLNDGTYEARTEAPDENGFIDIVTMTVADGKITEVTWDAETEDGTLKSVLSETGQYTMTEDGPTWKEQAEALGAAVVAGQSVDAVGMNEQGKTDAVSGVSIYIGGFTALAEECMKAASAPAVVLNDGTYEARTEAPDENGFIDIVTMTVADGKITEVTWDAETEDGTLKSVLSETGQYTMTEDGPTWKEQAEALGAAVVAGQSVDAVGMNEQGKTDAVSGVSIYIGGFTALVEECMKEAAGTQTAALKDGTYEARTEGPDDNGFVDVVTVTVADGKITAVTWDGEKEDGTLKSVLSENGQYVMTEDGLTWKAQAEALGAAIVAGQSVDAVGLNDQGKTDAVSGVSIYIGGFTALVEQCLTEAAGEEAAATEAVEETAPQNGTQVDAVSGATISSTAAVRGINDAFAFVQTVK